MSNDYVVCTPETKIIMNVNCHWKSLKNFNELKKKILNPKNVSCEDSQAHRTRNMKTWLSS